MTGTHSRAEDLLPADPEQRAILHDRAVELAATTPSTTNDLDGIELLVVELANGDRAALVYDAMSEVIPCEHLAVVPGTPDSVLGIISYQGSLLTVVDLSRVLGVRGDGREAFEAVLVGESGEHRVGFAVPQLVGSTRADAGAFQSAPQHRGGSFISGIAPGGLPVIDLPALLRSDRLVVDSNQARREADVSS